MERDARARAEVGLGIRPSDAEYTGTAIHTASGTDSRVRSDAPLGIGERESLLAPVHRQRGTDASRHGVLSDDRQIHRLFEKMQGAQAEGGLAV